LAIYLFVLFYIYRSGPKFGQLSSTEKSCVLFFRYVWLRFRRFFSQTHLFTLFLKPFQLSYYGRAMSQYMQDTSPNVTSSSYLPYGYGTSGGQPTSGNDESGSHSPTSSISSASAALAGPANTQCDVMMPASKCPAFRMSTKQQF
jgi:hypothetical protein